MSKFEFPVIVKPANLGSSVGINICENEQSLISAIEFAFLYDEKVIVEDYIANAKEFACAVVKVSGSAITSKIQQMCKGDIYTFEDKYISKKTQKNENLDEKSQKRIKSLSQKAYFALECEGVVRVDFLYDEGGDKLYVNEINTIPGSLAFNLFDVPFKDLLDVLIAEAKARRNEKDKDVYLFSSDALRAYAELASRNKYAK